MISQEQLAAAQRIFDYLAVADAAPTAVDLVFGFGHFDPKIPRQCCDVFRRQPAAQGIVFTGGVGAGTADIGKPEARYFLEVAREYAPEIPPEKFIIEDRSTNTGDNLAFTLEQIRNRRPDLQFGKNVHAIAAVANAYRQRRVWLTCQKFLPGVAIINAPPPTDFATESALFAGKGQNLISFLPGEIERIIAYGGKNWIQAETVPEGIISACATLKRHGGD